MRVRLSADARDDLKSVRDHVAGNADPVIAASVIARIGTVMMTLASFPGIGHDGIVGGTSEMAVPRLPYVLVYRIEMNDTEDELVVLRVFHTARDR